MVEKSNAVLTRLFSHLLPEFSFIDILECVT